MKSIFVFVLTFVIAGVVAAATFKDEVAGKWSLNVDAPGEAVQVQLDLKQDGETVTGTMAPGGGPRQITQGTYKNQEITGKKKKSL